MVKTVGSLVSAMGEAAMSFSRERGGRRDEHHLPDGRANGEGALLGAAWQAGDSAWAALGSREALACGRWRVRARVLPGQAEPASPMRREREKPRGGLGQTRGREQITARPEAPGTRNEQGGDATSHYDRLLLIAL